MDQINRINPVVEILRVSPRRVNKLFLQKEEGHRPVGTIIGLAKANRIPCVFLPKQALDKMSPHHQGVVAVLSPKEYVSLEEILACAWPSPFLVLLD